MIFFILPRNLNPQLNMKSLAIFALLIFPGIAMSQVMLPFNNQSHYITYLVSQESKANQDKLFLISRDWATSGFKNYKDVVQLDDKELGKIHLSGTSDISGYPLHYLKYHIKILCGPQKYAMEISDVRYISTVNNEDIPLEKFYVNYLNGYDEVKALKAKIPAANKRDSKSMNKQVFDLESISFVLSPEMKEIDRSLQIISDSYRQFMKKRDK